MVEQWFPKKRQFIEIKNTVVDNKNIVFASKFPNPFSTTKKGKNSMEK